MGLLLTDEFSRLGVSLFSILESLRQLLSWYLSEHLYIV